MKLGATQNQIPVRRLMKDVTKWLLIGCLGIASACATVEGTSVALNNTNKSLLEGKWVGTFKAVGAITGTVYRNSPVTYVIEGGSAGKGTYSTSRGEGDLTWRVADGKVIITLVTHDRPDRVYTFSRGQDGKLYLQASWDAIVSCPSRPQGCPQIHSTVLKKQ